MRRKGNKFAQSALKQSNCITDFITQNVLFYTQPKFLNLFKKYIHIIGVDIQHK
ncbi:hypothetical protein GO684_02045 [Wolbachia endosymbiont of Litomosoides brasiliensis]|uniref:hypothetical protein n=1 Tax=Wolbachia endosymbiont of Litomosoides brasiliensis TaxID=1812117 RepID=UPI00158DB8FB|nr:hypothetical protein [Wolbachia endosymbiont of Litomosoides brasiliensis]NUY39472.1 hypothetical protein [Wolbachia endosymbiont of Litomosoides brasiliensis]